LKGVEAVKNFTKEILGTVASGDNFMLTVTEDIPYRELDDVLEPSLRAIAEVMWKYGKYPINISSIS